MTDLSKNILALREKKAVVEKAVAKLQLRSKSLWEK